MITTTIHNDILHNYFHMLHRAQIRAAANNHAASRTTTTTKSTEMLLVTTEPHMLSNREVLLSILTYCRDFMRHATDLNLLSSVLPYQKSFRVGWIILKS